MTTQMSNVDNFEDDIWCNKDGVTNILSFSRVCNVGCDTGHDCQNNCFYIETNKGRIEFHETQEGLCAHKIPRNQKFSFLNTVKENKKQFTKRQVQRADRAMQLYETMGPGSMRDFQTVIQMNGIKNCPMVQDDIKVMQKIYGDHNVFALKGKATRTKPKTVIMDSFEVPQELKFDNRDVELCIDIMCMQGMPFLVTISKNIKLITVAKLANRKKETIAEALDTTLVLHNNAGFIITDIHGDLEFKCLEQDLAQEDNGITLHCVARGQHVPEVEHCVRTIKERIRVLWNALPHTSMPHDMIEYLVHRQVKWLNMFPPQGGVSAHCSPRTIMGQAPIDYNVHCVCSFGASAQAEYITDPTNTMEERTKDCIFLDAFDGPQGGCELLNLTSGEIITAYKLYEVPITALVKQ